MTISESRCRKVSSEKKKTVIRQLFLPAFTVIMILVTGISSFAAAGRISKIGISLKDVDRRGDGYVYDCDISTGSYSEVESISWSSDTEKPGQKITAAVTVIPVEGFQFVPSGQKKTKVSVDGGSLASCSVAADRITCHITYLTKMRLSPVDPDSMYIDEDGSTLHWEKAANASAYRVNLSGGTDLNIRVTDQTYVDLSKYVTDDLEETRIRIQTIPKTEAQKKYLFDSVWTEYTDTVLPAESNTVSGVFEGSVPHLRFRTREDDDGTPYFAIKWQYIGGRWYYFDPEGSHCALTGWLSDNGKWYYLDPNTAQMVTGWLFVREETGSSWYFLSASGEMLTGWIQDSPGGKWYYLDEKTGRMWSSAVTPDGYRVDASGAWIP